MHTKCAIRRLSVLIPPLCGDMWRCVKINFVLNNCVNVCNSSNAFYSGSPGKRRAAARTASRISYAKSDIAKVKSVKQYYASHKKGVSSSKRQSPTQA